MCMSTQNIMLMFMYDQEVYVCQMTNGCDTCNLHNFSEKNTKESKFLLEFICQNDVTYMLTLRQVSGSYANHFISFNNHSYFLLKFQQFFGTVALLFFRYRTLSIPKFPCFFLIFVLFCCLITIAALRDVSLLCSLVVKVSS